MLGRIEGESSLHPMEWDKWAEIMQNRQRSWKNIKVGSCLLTLKGAEYLTEERKALPPPFPPAHQPVGFSPQMGQRVGCLPDIGSSCGQQLESFSVTWTALEENLGRDGLGSYSTMWKTAGQPPLTTKAACNGTATPFGTLPLKALWPALGWAEEHIRHHHNPRRDDRSPSLIPTR